MRQTVIAERPFVVMLIGMRINSIARPDQWVPVIRAMARMVAELRRRPEDGLLHAQNWVGRTSLMVQYWRDHESLEAYATRRDREHRPAWGDFNKRIRGNGHVGIWHETYMVEPGRVECVYGDMPPFGLGRAFALRDAVGPLASAPGRLAAGAAAAAALRDRMRP